MTSRTAAAIVTTSLLLAATAGLDAGEKLTLKVTPNVSSAPSTVVVRATVARHAGNRALHIEADSGAFYRSSEVQLDGEHAPLVTEVPPEEPAEWRVHCIGGAARRPGPANLRAADGADSIGARRAVSGGRS